MQNIYKNHKKNLLVALFKAFKKEYLGILIMGLVTTLIDVITPFLVQKII
jgi:hypothetical protein